jgi:hypothetical protein
MVSIVNNSTKKRIVRKFAQAASSVYLAIKIRSKISPTKNPNEAPQIVTPILGDRVEPKASTAPLPNAK